MRITGFIALALVVTVAIGTIIASRLAAGIPEPHASCVAAWQEQPDSPLRPFGGADLRLDEGGSSVEGDQIVTRIGPVTRSSGQPVSLPCIKDGDTVIAATDDDD